VTWLSPTVLLGIVVGYLVFLFVVASASEAFAPRLARLRTLTYVLAASVYCTAWTFYGSVGLAANRGLEFLTIYLGPACVAILWPLLLRKLVRVSKEQRITSISDFISSRYGKSAPLGTLVAVLVVGGMIPYIALQLKAVSASFKMILRQESVLEVFDPTLLIAVTLALFGILFGARNLDFTKRQTGLMTAVAVESIVKLLAFLVIGVYVTWVLFDGFADLFGTVSTHPEWSHLLTLGQPPTASYARWATMLVISMLAVMFLPRQFHVLVVQNPRVSDVNAVSWSFPLYLLLINLFVLPIAFAGLLVFPGAGADADSFILRLPLWFDSPIYTVVVFLGGFSAATAMIVVAREHWPTAAMEGNLSWELALPEHFEAVAELVTEDQVAESITCGPDPSKHLKAIAKYAEAGYDHICVHQVGKHQDGFFEFYAKEVLPHVQGGGEGSARDRKRKR